MNEAEMDRSFHIKQAILRNILHPAIRMHHIFVTKNCFIVLFCQILTLRMKKSLFGFSAVTQHVDLCGRIYSN